jgi:hypothetical protein
VTTGAVAFAVLVKSSLAQGQEPGPQLLAQLELLRNGLVTIGVGGVEIIQQPAALADHHEQTPARTMVFLVLLQVLGEVVNTLSEQGDLDVGGAGVALVQLEILNRFRFRFHTFQLLPTSLQLLCR